MRRVLGPLGLRTAAAHLVHQSSVETDLAPAWPHQFPGLRTRAVYHFYDCHVRFDEDQSEREVERTLDAAARGEGRRESAYEGASKSSVSARISPKFRRRAPCAALVAKAL